MLSLDVLIILSQVISKVVLIVVFKNEVKQLLYISSAYFSVFNFVIKEHCFRCQGRYVWEG